MWSKKKNDVAASNETCEHCSHVRSNSNTEHNECDRENVLPSSQDSSDSSTMLLDDTLNSTFSPSQLDSTYTNDADDSITIAKTTARSSIKAPFAKYCHQCFHQETFRISPECLIWTMSSK